MIGDLNTEAGRRWEELMQHTMKNRTEVPPNSEASQRTKDPPMYCDEYDAFEEMYEEYLEQLERWHMGG